MKSINLLLGIIILSSFVMCEEVVQPLPSESNLDHFEVLNKTLYKNRENTLTLKTYDSNNKLIDVDSFDISLENETISGKELIVKDDGIYEITFFLPNVDENNITYHFEVVKQDKVLKLDKSFKISNFNFNFNFTEILDKINDWVSNNEEKAMLYCISIVILLVLFTVISAVSKN